MLWEASRRTLETMDEAGLNRRAVIVGAFGGESTNSTKPRLAVEHLLYVVYIAKIVTLKLQTKA
jgi:hypothetical protein